MLLFVVVDCVNFFVVDCCVVAVVVDRRFLFVCSVGGCQEFFCVVKRSDVLRIGRPGAE